MGWFSKIERWWDGQSGLRQAILSFAVPWVAIGIFDYVSSRFGFVISWRPAVITITLLREWLLNGYVATAVVTGLVVGFWSYIAAGFKATRPILRALWPLGLIAAGFFIVPGLIDRWGARNDPTLFEPSKAFVAAVAKAKLDFVKMEPSELVRIYKDNTSVRATALVKPYLGKVMPISGVIYDIDAPTDNVNLYVKLNGSQTAALLNFEDEDRGPIWGLKKGQRIRANCLLVSVDENSVGLNGCKLAPN